MAMSKELKGTYREDWLKAIKLRALDIVKQTIMANKYESSEHYAEELRVIIEYAQDIARWGQELLEKEGVCYTSKAIDIPAP